MTNSPDTSTLSRAPVFAGSPFALLTQAITGWATASRNRQDYQALLLKTDTELEDIGIDRAWLLKEVRKGFWKA